MSRPRPAPTPIARAGWINHAACATPAHRELFWAVNDRPPGKPNPLLTRAIATACRVCADCPVLAECRTYAEHAHEQLFGIWGGRDYGTSWRGPHMTGEPLLREPMPTPHTWRPNPGSTASVCSLCGAWPATLLTGPTATDRMCEVCAKENDRE